MMHYRFIIMALISSLSVVAMHGDESDDGHSGSGMKEIITKTQNKKVEDSYCVINDKDSGYKIRVFPKRQTLYVENGPHLKHSAHKYPGDIEVETFKIKDHTL